MPDTALGILLRDLRRERALNLRELAQLAGVDHAYIQRLETGTKSSPSDEVLGKLAKALRAPKREAEMLSYLARNLDTPTLLVEFARGDPSVTFFEFRGIATTVHRGNARPGYATILKRLRTLWEDED